MEVANSPCHPDCAPCFYTTNQRSPKPKNINARFAVVVYTCTDAPMSQHLVEHLAACRPPVDCRDGGMNH